VRAPHDGEIDLDWLGHRVLSDRGFELGAVEDVEFDPESGALTSVHVTKGGAVTADRVLGAGSYAVVVEDPR
jgi:sporulation protein YlmC with PRC-barrel domain